MKYSGMLPAMAMLLLAILAPKTQALTIGQQCQNPATGLCWPYCTTDDCRRGISADPEEIRTKWIAWRDRHITPTAPIELSVGDIGGARVWKTDATGSLLGTTVSEGQAYAMVYAAYFDEQTLFDNLWTYYKGWSLWGTGLMQWCIDKDNQPCEGLGLGAATDGDEDAALALVMACKKVQAGAWKSGAFDYCADAKSTLDNIHRYEVAADGYLTPGNMWNSPALNPSYYSPGHYRVFDAFEGGSRWSIVADRSYENIDATQALSGNCSKLVPNWSDRSGAPYQALEGNTEYHLFGWDAARVLWRVALDKIWFDSPKSNETMNEMGGFFKQVGAANVKPVYNMDGTTDWPWGLNAFFSGNAGVSIWAADAPINPGLCGAAANQANSSAQDAYNVSKATAEPIGQYDYYNNAWQLFGLMTMSGNTPNLQAIADAPGKGLLAELYAGRGFRSLAGLAIADPSVDHRPANGSVRYRGYFKPLKTGLHSFKASPRDGLSMWIGDKLVLGPESGDHKVLLVAGQVVPMIVEFDGKSVPAPVISVSTPTQHWKAIPIAQLYPSSSSLSVSIFETGKKYTFNPGDSAGLCLASAGSVSVLDQCSRSESQAFAATVDPATGWTTLQVAGMCLTATATGVGSELCRGTDDQAWRAFEAGAGHVRLISRFQGKALAVSGSIGLAAPVVSSAFDPAQAGMRWIAAAQSSCGDGICQAGEGCTSCAQDCTCGACGNLCPDGLIPGMYSGQGFSQELGEAPACYSITGITGGIWNTPGAGTSKELYINGNLTPWGPGVGISGDACVYATQGTISGWVGIGTW